MRASHRRLRCTLIQICKMGVMSLHHAHNKVVQSRPRPSLFQIKRMDPQQTALTCLEPTHQCRLCPHPPPPARAFCTPWCASRLTCSNCDPNNPNVWCSLGVLYYQLHQNRDALDAYTRAIKLDPHLCEVRALTRCVWNSGQAERQTNTRGSKFGVMQRFVRGRLAGESFQISPRRVVLVHGLERR